MADAPAADAKAKKPMNVKGILTSVFLVADLAVIGAGLYMVFAATLGYTPPAIKEAELAQVRALASVAMEEIPDEPLIFTMEKITVNLAGEPKRMARIEVNVELLNPVGFAEVMESDRRARARDMITELLGSQTFSDIESIQGKLFLKDKITTGLNGLLQEGIVKAVYFSEFVVQ